MRTMGDKAPKLSVVIPVYNEASIVAQAAEELVEGLTARGWDFELIFAENGSKDSTPQILQGLSEREPRIRWFHSETPNYGSALKRGILEARGELVVCDEIDLCDLTFYDTALPLLERERLDMVVGSKAAKGASDRRPMVRRLATRVHNKLLKISLGFKGTDTHGLKAFRRERLLPVIQACVVDMDVFASEFVIRAWRQGLAVREIPIQLQEKRQPSIHLFRRVPNVLQNVVKLVYVIRVRGK
jgi:glycosyltransferase involved in cell wall biosynthesis